MAKASAADIREAILRTLPEDGGTIGNGRMREAIAAELDGDLDEADYFAVRDALVAEGLVATGKGRGGSVRRVLEDGAALTLQAQQIPEAAKAPKPKQEAMTLAQARRAKAEVKGKKSDDGNKVIAYQHDQKRRNNPDVGVVTPETDPDQPKTTWAWDPHIDPALQFDMGRAQIEQLIDDALASGDDATMRAALEQLKRQAAPYLNWTGKAERTSFEVDTVSLHVHERIDPASILAVVRKRLQQDKGEHAGTGDMFRAWFEEPLPYREAIEFYKHDRGWANRLVAGDSLLVMNSLLQKEGMAGQVQMIYIDPPYGIKYGSNFQPFVNKRDVKDRKDEDLTQEPEMIKAFRDTWELGVHSYLTYLRDRLLLARELLHESGSVFVQISDENLHHLRELMDEVFSAENFCSVITFAKTSGQTDNLLASVSDYIVWYAKDRKNVKYRQLYLDKQLDGPGGGEYKKLWLADGSKRQLQDSDVASGLIHDKQNKIYRLDNLTSQSPGTRYQVNHRGQDFFPAGYWKTEEASMPRLIRSGRVEARANSLAYIRLLQDFSVYATNSTWS